MNAIKHPLFRTILISILAALPFAVLLGNWSNSLVQKRLPSFGTVAEFNLKDQSGKELTKTNLLGKPWIASFMYTECPDLCPIMNRKLSELQSEVPQDVKFISYSVDPVRDTSEVLIRYASLFRAAPGRWLFLTGDAGTLNNVAESFHFNKIDNASLHSLKFALVDKAGEIRGYYDSDDGEALKRLVADSKRLAGGAR